MNSNQYAKNACGDSKIAKWALEGKYERRDYTLRRDLVNCQHAKRLRTLSHFGHFIISFRVIQHNFGLFVLFSFWNPYYDLLWWNREQVGWGGGCDRF